MPDAWRKQKTLSNFNKSEKQKEIMGFPISTNVEKLGPKVKKQRCHQNQRDDEECLKSTRHPTITNKKKGTIKTNRKTKLNKTVAKRHKLTRVSWNL